MQKSLVQLFSERGPGATCVSSLEAACLPVKNRSASPALDAAPGSETWVTRQDTWVLVLSNDGLQYLLQSRWPLSAPTLEDTELYS